MSEIERLRAAQLTSVAPHIGPLLDAWDGLMNDQKASIKADAPAFAESLERLNNAWMSE